MFNPAGIPFDQFIKEVKELPQLKVEYQLIQNPNKYLPDYMKEYLQIECLKDDVLIKCNFIYNQILSIPTLYFLLYKGMMIIYQDNQPLAISDYIQEEDELQYFIYDMDPINGIPMYTLHSCLVAEWIQVVKEGSYVLPLLSYFLSKLYIYI